MKKMSKVLVILTLLVAMIVPSMSFAASWKTNNISSSGTKITQSFYTTGCPGISLYFTNTDNYSQSYSIKLYKKTGSGDQLVKSTQGTVRGKDLSVGDINMTQQCYGNYYFKIETSSSVNWDGKYEYFN